MSTMPPAQDSRPLTEAVNVQPFPDRPPLLPYEAPAAVATVSLDLPVAGGNGATTRQAFDWAEVLRRRYTLGRSSEPQASFHLRHEWIGRVDDVRDGSFVATLVTRKAPEDIEQAEIDLEEIALGDRVHLRPGATFYWVVGYRDEPHGQRLGVSSILFRRMLEPTPEELERADANADRALAFLSGSDLGRESSS